MMQHPVALNTVLYLLLKPSGDNDDDDEDHLSTLHNNNIDAHPVMAKIKKCNSTMQKFDKHVHNPRVKKREQYRKTLISQKGAVREVPTEGHKYGGEQTGIKTKLSRSCRLIS
jgi:hypothetical protein